MSKDNSGPAFPGVEYSYYDGQPQICNDFVGMTKRELIAMHVLAGIRAGEGAPLYSSWQVAELARKDADALLAELAKE